MLGPGGRSHAHLLMYFKKKGKQNLPAMPSQGGRRSAPKEGNARPSFDEAGRYLFATVGIPE